MKKLLLILLCLPIIGFGQFTYVPDDNFEQALINLGYDTFLDDNVTTASIDTVTYLNIDSQGIADLTGIADFISLAFLSCRNNQLTSIDVSNNTAFTNLYCSGNQLTSIDVSNNTALTDLDCRYNQLVSLDVSQNLALTYLECRNNQLISLDVSNNTALADLCCKSNQLTSLDFSTNTALAFLECDDNQLNSLDVSQNTSLYYLKCDDNQLTVLDVSQNTALRFLWCGFNQITSLDVSNNIALVQLLCENNQLISLNVKNGNNYAFFTDFAPTPFFCINNPLLTCIEVDDVAYSTANWTDIDAQHYFSTNCSGTSLQEHATYKELLKVTDLLGRETKRKKNEPIFYIYNDGTVEKKITID